jgi:hypothetical protein
MLSLFRLSVSGADRLPQFPSFTGPDGLTRLAIARQVPLASPCSLGRFLRVRSGNGTVANGVLPKT